MKKTVREIMRKLVTVLVLVNAFGISGSIFVLTASAKELMHFPMNKGEGDTISDIISNEVTGNLINSPKWYTGKGRSGLRFNGSDQWVELNSSIDLGTNNFTIALWVEVDSMNPVGAGIFNLRHSSGDRQGVQLTTYRASDLPSDQEPREVRVLLDFETPGEENKKNGVTGKLSKTGWRHIAVTVDRQMKIILYIDGEEVDSANISEKQELNLGSSQPLRLGRDHGSNFFDGSIDGFHLFDTALSATEVFALMKKDGPTPGLINPSSVGPRSDIWTTLDSIEDTPECDNCQPVDVTNFKEGGTGATPDDGRDDDDDIRDAFEKSNHVFFPTGVYNTSDPIKLPENGGIYGQGAHIRSSNKQVLGVAGSHAYVRGMTIESTHLEDADSIEERQSAPACIESNDKDNFVLEDNTFKNCRIRFRNKRHLVGVEHIGPNGPKKIRIDHNKFDIDFSDLDSSSTKQNDLITIRGIENVAITNNDFMAKEFHRLLKIADIEIDKMDEAGILEFKDNYKITPHNSRDILIENNRIDIISTKGRGKQMIDMFDGTQGLIFQHNEIVRAVGFQPILENKTAKETNFSQNTIVKHNIIRSDGLMLRFQGSYGLFQWKDNNGDFKAKSESGI